MYKQQKRVHSGYKIQGSFRENKEHFILRLLFQIKVTFWGFFCTLCFCGKRLNRFIAFQSNGLPKMNLSSFQIGKNLAFCVRHKKLHISN